MKEFLLRTFMTFQKRESHLLLISFVSKSTQFRFVCRSAFRFVVSLIHTPISLSVVYKSPVDLEINASKDVQKLFIHEEVHARCEARFDHRWPESFIKT